MNHHQTPKRCRQLGHEDLKSSSIATPKAHLHPSITIQHGRAIQPPILLPYLPYPERFSYGAPVSVTALRLLVGYATRAVDLSIKRSSVGRRSPTPSEGRKK